MSKKWKLFRGLAAVLCALAILLLNVTQMMADNQGSISRFLGVSVESSGEMTAETMTYECLHHRSHQEHDDFLQCHRRLLYCPQRRSDE